MKAGGTPWPCFHEKILLKSDVRKSSEIGGFYSGFLERIISCFCKVGEKFLSKKIGIDTK